VSDLLSARSSSIRTRAMARMSLSEAVRKDSKVSGVCCRPLRRRPRRTPRPRQLLLHADGYPGNIAPAGQPSPVPLTDPIRVRQSWHIMRNFVHKIFTTSLLSAELKLRCLWQSGAANNPQFLKVFYRLMQRFVFETRADAWNNCV